MGNKFPARYGPTPRETGGPSGDPNCTLELSRNWRRNGCDPTIWLSQFLKNYDISTKERTLVRTLVQWLSGVFDQLNSPFMSCCEELARRICQLIEGSRAEIMGNRTGLLSNGSPACKPTSSCVVPVTTRCDARRMGKEV